jgi:lipopolysaccharide/colanic/teichoic acid biosynthesis glycosyltransferase
MQTINPRSYADMGTISNACATDLRENDWRRFTMMYIGVDRQYFNQSQHLLVPCFIAANCAEAKSMINSEQFRIAPAEVIIIDVDLDEYSILSLRAYIKAIKYCSDTLILYNSKRVTNGSIFQYKDFIDDVLDIDQCPSDLENKINFLKASKQYIPALVSQVSVQGLNKFVHFSKSKRSLDVAVSLLAIIALLPLFALIAIAIVLESRGPVFYNAKRAGRGFRVFKFYKFRTMEVNADKKVEVLQYANQYNVQGSTAVFYKFSDDPRVTRVGKFLRNTSLDELPQLFNVLKGDMSLVGNRPLPLYEAESLTTNEYAERFVAPAGITGLWQVKKRGKADMSVEERLSLDISYARNYNLKTDFRIMAQTPAALLQKTSA